MHKEGELLFLRFCESKSLAVKLLRYKNVSLKRIAPKFYRYWNVNICIVDQQGLNGREIVIPQTDSKFLSVVSTESSSTMSVNFFSYSCDH